MSVATLVTAEQLIRMPSDCRCELLAGELKPMSPIGSIHCSVERVLGGILGNHVDKHRLGALLVGEPGFLVARDPDTVLAPDVAFIAADRLAAQPLTDRFWPGVPDLAVEVRAASESAKELREKALAWLDAGVHLVWIVDPASRTVTVCRSATDFEVLSEGAQLEAPDILPGFRCPVADLFTNL